MLYSLLKVLGTKKAIKKFPPLLSRKKNIKRWVHWIHVHLIVPTCPAVGHCIVYCIWGKLSQRNLPLKSKIKIIFWTAFHVSVILSLIFPSSCFSSFLFFSFSRPLLLEWRRQAPDLYFKVRGKEFCNEFLISPTSRGRNALWN